MRLTILATAIAALTLTPFAHAAAPTDNQLLFNPGFENAGDNWGKYGAADFHDWAKESQSYGAALWGWEANGAGGFFQSVSASPGREYEFSIRVRKEELFQAEEVFIRLEFYADDDSTKAGHDQGAVNVIEEITTDWKTITITGTAPIGTAFIRPVFGFEGANAGDLGKGKQSCMWDNASLTINP